MSSTFSASSGPLTPDATPDSRSSSPAPTWRSDVSDQLQRAVLLVGVPVANAAVFAGWNWPRRVGRVLGVSLYSVGAGHAGVLQRHFVLSLDNLRAGRVWTVLTCAFSHRSPYHLAGSLASLYSLTSTAFRAGVSPQDLAAVMLGSAMASSGLALLEIARSSSPGSRQAGVLGASGVVSGMWVFVMLTAHRAEKLSKGRSSQPWLAQRISLAYSVLWDFVLLPFSGATGISHAGHLGGFTFGLGYYLWFRSRNP